MYHTSNILLFSYYHYHLSEARIFQRADWSDIIVIENGFGHEYEQLLFVLHSFFGVMIEMAN